MRKVLIAVIILTGLFCYGISEAVQTKLLVRARSRDAKFIGTSMGGALVTIRDGTGKVLAEGLTAGGTGVDRKAVRVN